jgi:hypothetical protein
MMLMTDLLPWPELALPLRKLHLILLLQFTHLGGLVIEQHLPLLIL